MKILVLQLARLGDIYQSWPTLNALKKSNPGSEVHLLTRAAFSMAAPTFVDRHWCLETKKILRPLIDEKPDVDQAVTELSTLVDGLKAEKFDRIINLSYSPFSASLVFDLARGTKCQVAGYTRYPDRTLAIPDDTSAYFYAQVGVGKGNRVHLVDLFAHTAGVSLTEEDWLFALPDDSTSEVVKETGRGGIVVHLGASTLAKTLSWSKWLQVVKGLISTTDVPIILLGSKDEAEIADRVSDISGSRKPINLVGRTSLSELFTIIEAASLVVGGDSAPVQIASLTNTPVFNFSFPMVSLWETGPRSTGSRILPLETENSYSSDEIVKEITATLRTTPPALPVVRVVGRMLPYVESKPLPQTFEWEMIQALYMGELFPAQPSSTFGIGIQRLEEVNILAVEQLAALKKDSKNQTASLILSRVDDVMEHIIHLVPETAPLVRWFRVERLRIAPMHVAALIDTTHAAHHRFGEVLDLYLLRGDSNESISLDQK
jgi:heptosyltransferase-3